VRAQGGRGKHIQICLCLAQSAYWVTTKLGRRHRVSSYHQTSRGSDSVAVRTEKWTMPKNHKWYNVNVHFVVWDGEAKPKISFPFFVGSPHTPPPKKRRKVRKIFGFCSRDRRERTRRAISPFSVQNRFEQRIVFLHNVVKRNGAPTRRRVFMEC